MSASMIVHEAYTQRQFARLRTPVLVGLGGKTFRAADWSVAAVRVEGIAAPPALNQLVELTLKFQFENFALEMEATAAVKRLEPAERAAVFLFSDLTASAQSLLQYLVGAVVSGEAVAPGDVLAISRRENHAPPRLSGRPARRTGALAGRLALICALWVVGLGLLAFIISSLFTRTFVVEADGAIRSVAPVALAAPEGGHLASIAAAPGRRVQPGEPLALIALADGARRTVESPCDCIVGPAQLPPGAPVNPGSPILQLAPVAAPLEGEFVAPLDAAQRLQPGDRARVEFFGQHPPAGGEVVEILPPTYPEASAYTRSARGLVQLTGLVRVRFDEPLPASLVGRPASVRINLLKAPL